MRVASLFGIPIQAARMTDVLDSVDHAIRNRASLDIGVVNAAKVVNMSRDPELERAVLNSDQIFADGMSVVWASRILGDPLPERIAGIDLMHAILKQGCVKNYKVYCLGARQEVLDAACNEFRNIYPGVQIVGSHHGYFGEEDEAGVADLIRKAQPDVLFVAITSPKKEAFIARWSSRISVPVIHGVGGSFDVVAGLVERAPDAWQRAGLEWLYRLKQEPRRLWKRYLDTNTRFALMVARESVTRLRRA